MRMGLRSRRRVSQVSAFTFLSLAMAGVLVGLGALLCFILARGVRALSWEFLTAFPRRGMTEGGIFPALVGTLCLAVGTLIFSLPLGVAAAIYLAEYARQGPLVRLIRLAVNNLAGVPSVVFGLFGLALFVNALGLGVSVLSGSLTLALLVLPVIIRAAEEALRAVPREFREAAFALGATKWQTIRRVVLPVGLPGIITGAILALGRAAGETAPIIFTAAVFFGGLPDSPFSPVMALPYHLFVMATESIFYEETRPLQYGTAIVLLGLVLAIDLGAIAIRYRLRRKKRW
ncbi:TPA: phosphate ABC transporter permease PstA [Candidatus Bipolaricaulota bacterium]|nr:phosphate ABC transporter permease PstA [Candidatus Bipolaricaulota bacterium]